MVPPLIGLTVSQIPRSHQRKANLLLTEYTEAVHLSGGCPVLIPNEYPIAHLESLREVLQGILLTGGGDIHPMTYQAKNDDFADNIISERDQLEKALVELAVRTNWPLLGICRGQQMLNVALGGTLYTHIPAQFPTNIKHDQSERVPPTHIVHEVEILPNTRLGAIIPATVIKVNSRHHQAVKSVAPEMRAVAFHPETLKNGVPLIEAIEAKDPDRWAFGVQWHPENLVEMGNMAGSAARGLFHGFVQALQDSAYKAKAAAMEEVKA